MMKNDIERLLEGKEAVIFDVDGTLIDSMGVWEEVDRIYLTRHGKPMSEDLQRKLAGLSILQAADYFRNVIGIDDPPEKMLAEWNELAFEQYRHEIQMKPGAAKWLSFIEEKELPMAVATSNTRKLAMTALHAQDIEHYFRVIITGEDVVKGKPDPFVYQEAARRLGVNPANCLVFEDIPEGIQAGLSAGMTVCAVQDDFSDYQIDEKKGFAEEKNEEQNTETDIICNWPEDIIDPGPALPQYLSAPKIMNILNTNKGIKVQWKKVNNAHGYRIQRKLGNSKWKDLKILKENQYTDKTVENGKKYQYKIYAYASNSIDFIESTGTKSTTKKILYLKAPVISNIKKSQNTRYKIVWKKNKKADGYKIQISTSKKFKNNKSKIKEISTYKFNPKIYGMKKKKSYYVRIRAYKVDGKQLHYSAWSNIKILK